jgi:hypothetical protein
VNSNTSGVVIVTGVAKKKVDKKKGELIEQNQDGLEVGYIMAMDCIWSLVFDETHNYIFWCG